MKVPVHMLAFGEPGEVREVTLVGYHPRGNEPRDILDAVFYWGQNDFQSQNHPSVSMGDVIEYPTGMYYVVLMMGFRQITTEQFQKYKDTPREDRHCYNWQAK